MRSAALPKSFELRQVGCQVLDILARRTAGQVIAVFDSSFYFAADDRLTCVGHAGLNAGPLNLVTSVPEQVNWPSSGLQVGARVSIAPDVIRVDERFIFQCDTATPWAPPPTPRNWSPQSLARGLDAAAAHCRQRPPTDGVGMLILNPPPALAPNTVAASAMPAIEALRHWLTTDADRPDAPEWPAKLIGLGPGLTPSGDDFIGGMMIAFHQLGATSTATMVWEAIHPKAVAATNHISRAHLDAAAAGYGAAELHDAIIALQGGDPIAIAATMEAAAAIGHTSGWDTLAGAVTAGRCWLAMGR